MLHYLPNLEMLTLCDNDITYISLDHVENLQMEVDLATYRRNDFQKGNDYLNGNKINNLRLILCLF
jgi:hypothetical protein